MAKQKKGAAVAPKVLEAQHRNEIIRRFKNFITEQSSAEIAALLTPHDYEMLYFCKTGGVRVIPRIPGQIEKVELDEIKDFITYLLKERRCEMLPNKPEVSLYDLLTLGIPLLHVLAFKYEEDNEQTRLLMAEFGSPQLVEEQFKKNMVAFYKVSYSVGAIQSSYEKGFIYIYPDKKYATDRRIRLVTFIACHHTPETRMFKIDGHSREAIRVAWFHENTPIEHLLYHDITVAELGLNHPHPTTMLKVYIQKHAIHRINERLDSIRRGGATGSIFFSLQTPRTTPIRKNKLLIEFHYNHIKVGYFVATVEDDALLLRTFLFITSNGTPEGDRLKQLTGLQMLDKKYLAIDKLSSFVSKEVMENEEIRKIFDKAGCSDLFDENIHNYCEQEFLSKHTPAVKLPSYICNNTEESWIDEEEEAKDNQTTDYEAKLENLEKTSLKQRTEQALLSLVKRIKRVLKRE